MQPVQIYLQFDGRCEAALRWYEEVLGARIESMKKFRGSPMEKEVPPESLDRVMHANISVRGTHIMASDPRPGQAVAPMSGFWISIYAETLDEGKRLFEKLAEGGRTTLPFGPVFWGGRFGMVTDRFGTPWMISSPG